MLYQNFFDLLKLYNAVTLKKKKNSCLQKQKKLAAITKNGISVVSLF